MIFATSLVGSRLLFALQQREILHAPLARWPELLNPIPATIGPGTPGLSMTGGVLLALAAALLVLRLRGLPVLRYADVAAPSVALGEAITRIGCFLNGCCGGTPCSLPWCVRFPVGNASVHPTQLYASLAAFLLFFGLLALARRRPTPGTVTAAWLLGASTGRALVDLFRHYPEETQLAIPGLARDPGARAGQPRVVRDRPVAVAALARRRLASAPLASRSAASTPSAGPWSDGTGFAHRGAAEHDLTLERHRHVEGRPPEREQERVDGNGDRHVHGSVHGPTRLDRRQRAAVLVQLPARRAEVRNLVDGAAERRAGRPTRCPSPRPLRSRRAARGRCRARSASPKPATRRVRPRAKRSRTRARRGSRSSG